MYWIDKLRELGAEESDGNQFLLDYYGCSSENIPAKPIVVGAGSIGELVVSDFISSGYDITSLIDENPSAIGKNIFGYEVRPLSSIAGASRGTPIVMATHRTLALKNKLLGMGFTRVLPFPLLHCISQAHFRAHPFYANLQRATVENRAALESLYWRLSDEHSRKTLDAYIGFRMTLDPALIAPVMVGDQYMDQSILGLSSFEYYVDCGAFNGDSVRDFIRSVNSRYRGITAFEPSQEPFRQLRKEFGDDSRHVLHNACVYHSRAMVSFGSEGSRDTAIFGAVEASNLITAQALCIDELAEAKNITFIKMNIEGAECDAITGAKETIRRNKPKLAIALYHKAGDLWQLPHIINELNNEYQFYFRHHDGGIVEAVFYAV